MKVVNLTYSEEFDSFGGFYEDKKKYYKFRVSKTDQVVMEIKQKFKSYDHFVGVFSKFNPYTFFWKKPSTIKKLNYESLDKLKPKIIKINV